MIAHGELRDKVVVVTGSSSGIGRAVALAFGERGACVVFNGRSPAKLAKVLNHATARGIRGMAVRADVATTAGAHQLINAAFRRFGRVDVLVNNAGSGGPSPKPFWTLDSKAWDATMAINVQAALACSRAYVKRLRRQTGTGRIINVSSIAASRGFQGLACYCATKFALRGLTECMALDLAGSNIVVVSLELAGHRTAMTRRLLSHEIYAGLSTPEEAVDLFLYAAAGPAELLHGRTLSETRYRIDAEAEAQLNSELASTAPWLPYMARYSLQQKFGDALHMDFLENSIGPSAAANDALRGSAGAAMARYPDPRLGALRAKLSDRTGIPADCFTFGNGSTEIVDRVLRTFVRPGETVVASDPTWPVFERMCRLHGIGIISVPYHLDLASGCARLDLNDILRAIDTRTRLIYLVSPNNPLGASVPEEEFRQFLTRLRPHLPVVVDGAYAEYCSRPDALQARRVLSETDKPLIGIHTFSKFFGLAGLRIGYAYAHQSVLALISRLHLPFSVSGPAEAAAVGALCDEVHAQQTLTAVREGRRQVRDALKGMGLRSLASDANFVMAELPAPAEVVYQTLTDEHIYLPEVVWNGLMQLPIGTEDENRRYLDILARLKRSQHG